MISIDISDVFYGYLLPKSFDQNTLDDINRILSKIGKEKRYQERYNDYMQKYFGDFKCDEHIAGQDNYIE